MISSFLCVDLLKKLRLVVSSKKVFVVLNVRLVFPAYGVVVTVLLMNGCGLMAAV